MKKNSSRNYNKTRKLNKTNQRKLHAPELGQAQQEWVGVKHIYAQPCHNLAQ